MYEPNICLYHADCTDGFGAAWAIHRRWPTCTFIPAEYGAPLNLEDIEGKNILFVDFSAPAETLRAMVNEGGARSVVVLDHHKSAQAALSGLPTFTGDMDFLDPYDPILVWFDMERSGAGMAWEFAHGPATVPDMIVLVEDRDLWRFSDPATKPFIAALNSYPQDFQVWDRLMLRVEALIEEGEPILRAQAAAVEMLLKHSYSGDIAGHTIPLVNAPKQFSSDACHRLLELNPEAPFAASWFRRGDGLLEFSLRSEAHRQDVSEVAVLFGGGGHRNAAGFQLMVAQHGHNVGAV
ncbi:phosphohydrolase [Mesorhizobium sp. B2-1-2]|uniref:phosphohydrolase n=1 Tax=Mesorhizobium sp. B2-1-2 TaxID=2589973 RepID=UPI00112A4818|nr:phosphohydrolase [Mesorhizobium sp. B2-1-2]TPN11700.1 phosphohydrolase [Mesorhizobium sp. B2-1-2]